MAADHVLPSRPENVTWGWIPMDARPALTIRSGQTVRIDTLSHHGSTQDEDPVTFLPKLGVKRDEILQDVRDFWASRAGRPRRRPRRRPCAHRPGRDRRRRAGRHARGADPRARAARAVRREHDRSDEWRLRQGLSGRPRRRCRSRRRAGHAASASHGHGERPRRSCFSPTDIHVPSRRSWASWPSRLERRRSGEPGVTIDGVQSSTPPGPYGGNMDLKDLTVGSTLYLPVFHTGRFSTLAIRTAPKDTAR